MFRFPSIMRVQGLPSVGGLGRAQLVKTVKGGIWQEMRVISIELKVFGGGKRCEDKNFSKVTTGSVALEIGLRLVRSKRFKLGKLGLHL